MLRYLVESTTNAGSPLEPLLPLAPEREDKEHG